MPPGGAGGGRVSRPRAREFGIRFGVHPAGRWNAITDVPGVRVGHCTRIEGSGPLVPGRGPVRTGVTVIHPHEDDVFLEQVPAAVHVLNGAGAMVGRSQVEEWGLLETPILLTDTELVGRVYDAAISWLARIHPEIGVTEGPVIPLVAECSSMVLNDIVGRHLREEHVFKALEAAAPGPVAEGGVGGGTGMMCYEFKGGIGTSSRVVRGLGAARGGGAGSRSGVSGTVGVLVMANHGAREHLVIQGVPVGRMITDLRPDWRRALEGRTTDGSIIIIVGTDLPLDTRQLRRLAVRATLGLARTGSTARHGSGDIVLAFSNHRANRVKRDPASAPNRGAPHPLGRVTVLRDDFIGPVFEAVVEATEEAVINALFAGETMTGRDDITVHGLPLERLREIMAPGPT